MSREPSGEQRALPAAARPEQPDGALQEADCVCEAVQKEYLSCPVCMETLCDPFVTACGHTFCYGCLTQSLQHNKHCPSCSHYLTTDLIYPNFLLSKIVRRARSRAVSTPPSALELLRHAIADHKEALQEADVDQLLQQLWEHKQALQQQQREASMELLLHFLHSSRQDKEQRLAQLQQELMCLEGDIQRVEAAGMAGAAPSSSQQARPATPGAGPAAVAESRPASAAGDAAPAADAEMGSGQQLGNAFNVAQQHQHQQQGRSATHSTQVPQPVPAAAVPAVLVPSGAQAGAAEAISKGAAAGDVAATAVGESGEHRPELLQQQHQALQQVQEQRTQHVAAFAGAAFASLAAQALAGVSQPQPPVVMPGVNGLPTLAAAGTVSQQAQQQQLPHNHHHWHPPPHHQHHHNHLPQPYPGLSSLHAGHSSFLSPAATTSSGGAGNSGGHTGSRDVLSLLRNKKRRIASQFDDLQQRYLQLRANQLRQAAAGGSTGNRMPSGGAAGGSGDGGAVGALVDEGLQEFSRLLSVITRCNKLKLVAEVQRPPLRQSTAIISSLEFDKEGALFATAGVSKRISIFEFASVVPSLASPGLHTPVVELVSRSKLSCLSWNKYIQAHIASSDYEGVVSVWDVSTSGQLLEYEAHSKRIWSVDFCAADPSLLASGSDDCAVKVWSTKSPSSVAQIDTKANVCTVRWRPGSAHELAVGSADHGVYLYDTRRTATPVATYRGHRKAVSYVRFSGSDEVVSASTDSTLRLWGLEVPGSEALRVYEGHSNEKNFVGLAVDGDFLACGSESSELYVYYKALSKPVAQQAFTPPGEVADGDTHHDKTFISAVCWRPGAQTLLAANSMGTVKVFALTGSGQAQC